MNRTESWPLVRLGDHVDLLTGFPFQSTEYVDDLEGVRLLRGDNVAQGDLRWDGVKRWPRSKATGLGKYWLQMSDVILAMDRPWIEAGLKYAWVTEQDLPSLLVQRVARMRGANGLTTEYLRYVIGALSFTDYIKPIVTGVAVPHISGPQIQAYRFRLPSLETQRKIAAILSAYDDLIEVNTRRIALLEEMARGLYREWFVRYRFPGHERARMVESAVGLAPEGWEVKALGDIADVNAAAIKKGSEPERISYVDISSVSPGKIDKFEPMPFAEAPGRARRIVRHGDIIWSTVRPNRRSYALILNPPPDMVVSTGFAVITSEAIPFSYLYHALTTDEFAGYLTNHATGSAYPAVNAGDFEAALIVVPPKRLLDDYDKVVSDVLTQQQVLHEKNANLRRTRDLLLPRLVSGEVDVGGVP
jgi:type I restriction enzyme, S subunit